MNSTDADTTAQSPIKYMDFLEIKGGKIENKIHLVKVLKGALTLNEDITTFNFYCSWLQLILIALVMVSVDTLQALILKEKFSINQTEIGLTIAKIQLIDYSSRIIMAMFYGPLIDFVGRKIMYYYSIINIVIGFYIIPLQSSIFPGYLLSRLIISNGSVVLQMLPLLADYIHISNRGTAAGLNYTLAFLGAILSASCLYIFSNEGLVLETDYYIIGSFILVFGSLLGLGVKGGNQYYKRKATELQSEVTEDISYNEQLKKVCKSFKDIPWLYISMICSVLGNSDFYVLTTGMVFLVQAYIPDSVKASTQVGQIQGIFFIISFTVSLIYGKLMDKVSHIRLLLPLMLVATIGFYTVPFFTDVSGLLFYTFVIVEAISLPGVFLFATFLGVKYCPSDQRGTIGGIITSVGFLAAMGVLVVGGFMYDNGIIDASLLIFGGIITVSTLGVVLIYFIKIRPKRLSTEAERLLIEDNTK